jgi:hypothetical protein
MNLVVHVACESFCGEVSREEQNLETLLVNGNNYIKSSLRKFDVMFWTGIIWFRIRTNICPNCEQGTVEAPYRVFSLFAVPVDILRYKTSQFIITVHLRCIIYSIHCLLMDTKTINYAAGFTDYYMDHE